MPTETSVSPLGAAVWRREPLTEDVVIDAHAHLGPYSLFYIPDPDAAAMVRVMDRCGVTRTVLSSHLAIQADATRGNDATAAAVDAFPDRLAGYLVINPWQDPPAEIERRADDPRFVGIKLHPSLHQYPLSGPRYEPVWELAAATGKPVLTHTWENSTYDRPAIVGQVAERHPDVTILAGHAGAMQTGFLEAIEVARRHPRVVLEICGSFNSGRQIVRMVDELGPHKVVYGSDFPFIDLRVSIGRVVFAELSEGNRRAVLGQTMARILAGRDTA